MVKRGMYFILICTLLMMITGCDDEKKEDTRDYPDRYQRYTVSDTVAGAAFAVVEDINGDDFDDIVVSAYGEEINTLPGYGSIFIGSGNLESWTEKEYFGVEEAFRFPTEPLPEDIDGDGDMDILLQGGFFLCGVPCGFVAWFEQDGDTWIRHDVQPNGYEFFFHGSVLADMNQDGIRDIVTTAEKYGAEKAEVPYIYLGNNQPDRFDSTPLELGMGLGSVPNVYDIDGDGDLDIASAEFFLPDSYEPFSFAWFEQTAPITDANPNGTWERNIIADTMGPSIMLGLVPDLYGDGKLYAVGSNHTNTNEGDPWESAVYTFELVEGSETEIWPNQMISEGIESRPGLGQMAPGVFGWGDVNGDGDIDIAVSGDGDDRIFVLEQTGSGGFTTNVLAAGLGQASGMKIVDTDKDGNAEIVITSYEQNAVYIYEYIPQ
jgi:hypothetical protein